MEEKFLGRNGLVAPFQSFKVVWYPFCLWVWIDPFLKFIHLFIYLPKI